MIYHENKMLKDLCTFAIGGPAKYYTEVKNLDELRSAFAFCKEKNLPFFILGKGSNSLFDDEGFPGVVIGNKIDFFESRSPGIFRVGAGYSFPLLGVQTARQQWAGLEFASGIPCSVGGAVFMNAGANGSETSQYLDSVEYLTDEGELKMFLKSELEFSYRTSPFQKMKGSIVGVTFKLVKNSEARAKQLHIISYRTKTQPYGDKSAGCVFRNPPDDFAGALIEKAGLKGYCIGGACVSELHANFIVNKGDATCQDVLNLISYIKKTIKATFDVELEMEIRTFKETLSIHG